MGGEGLAGAVILRWAGREEGEEGFGKGEDLGRECVENGGEGAVLGVGREEAGYEGAVAADGIAVVEAADGFGGSFGLVAVEEIKGDEGVFKVGHGLAGLDGVCTEAGEGGFADGKETGEFGGGVGAVVPEVGPGAEAAEGACIGVSEVAEAGGLAGIEEGVEGVGLVSTGGELGVAVADGCDVPGADAGGVGVVEGGLAEGVEGDEGVGVVHDGGALGDGGGGEVVLEAEGVADLVGSELAGAGEDHFEHIGRDGFALGVGSKEGFRDAVVLAGAEAAEGYLTFDDFAGAGVGDGFAVAPTAGGAVDPLDDVVANIHGVGVGREDADLEGVFEAGSLKSGRPPTGAFDEGGADGLGCAAIDVVDDGVYRLAEGGGGVALDEAVADDELLVEGLAEGNGVVAEALAEESGAGVEAAGLVAGVGELDEGGVFADGDGAGVGGDVADELAGGCAVGGEGELGLDLSVLGEVLGGVEGDGGAGGVEVVGALVGGLEGFGDVVCVAEEEVCGVDEEDCGMRRGGGVLGLDFEAPEDAFCEGLAYGEALGGIRGAGTVVEVGLDEEDFAADAGEVDDAAGAELAAVEADVVGAEAPGELVEEEEVVVGGGEFHEELAGAGIPEEGEEAGARFEAGGFLCDGGGGRRDGWLGGGRQDGERGEEEQGGEFGGEKRLHECQSNAGMGWKWESGREFSSR